MKGIIIIGAVGLCLVCFSPALSEEPPPFATTSLEIIKLLMGDTEQASKEVAGAGGKSEWKAIMSGKKTGNKNSPPRVAMSINFIYDSDVVTDESKPLIKELGTALASPQLNGFTFIIAGHTDSDGSESFNLALSRKRAVRVKELLVYSFDIPASKLKIGAFGESRPIASNETVEGKAMNRRVEITRVVK